MSQRGNAHAAGPVLLRAKRRIGEERFSGVVVCRRGWLRHFRRRCTRTCNGPKWAGQMP